VAPNERSNGHAHVKSFLLGSSESLIVEKGQLLLGEKQSLFFVEMDGGRNREVRLKIIGNDALMGIFVVLQTLTDNYRLMIKMVGGCVGTKMPINLINVSSRSAGPWPAY